VLTPEEIVRLLENARVGCYRTLLTMAATTGISSLLNEPIPGQGVFWSSVKGKPYPVSLRVQSFEGMFSMHDKHYNLPAARTYAETLLSTFGAGADRSSPMARAPSAGAAVAPSQGDDTGSEAIDVMVSIESRAISVLQSHRETEKLRKDGVPWMAVQQVLKNALPEHLDDRDGFAYNLVPKALSSIFGPQSKGWESFKHPATGRTWVRVKGKD
jgi:hypothetical protein